MRVHIEDLFGPVVKLNYPPNDEYNKKVESLVQAVQIFSHAIQQCAYIIVDCHKREFIYVSESPSLLCGRTAENIAKLGYHFYLNHVPEEDMTLLLETNKIWLSFFNSIPVPDRLKYSISCDFHLVTSGKKHTLVNHRIAPLVLDKQFHIWLTLCVITHSSAENSGNIIVTKRDEDRIYEYNLKDKRWIPGSKIKLTAQEKEVLVLSARGSTINRIAKQLHIEEVTVKFHRKNIFTKLKVKNISEAIMYATTNGLF